MHDPGTRATPRALGSTLALATRRRRGYILPRQPGPAAAAAQGPRSSSRSPQPWDHVLHAPTGTQARGPRHSRSPRPSVLAAGAPACPHGGPAARTAAMPRLLGPHPHVCVPRTQSRLCNAVGFHKAPLITLETNEMGIGCWEDISRSEALPPS